MAKLKPVFGLLLGLTLVACKTELYSELPEEQANEMMALLMANGIDAEKGPAAKGLAPLSVPTSEMSSAIDLLRSNGYPRDSFDNLGTVFEQKGLVSSPLEERVRFVYGLSQTLSETLNQIDGVTAARVHIVLPDSDALTEKSGKSTASVFLKTRPDVDLSNKVPEIKQLVQASVEGLVYDSVVVTLFESSPRVAVLSASAGPPVVDDPDSSWASVVQQPIVLAVIGVVLLAGVGGAVFYLRRSKGGASLSLIPSSTANSNTSESKGTVQPAE
ncbi:MAG: type III secretion inner membrane ring lipoprotein SctJ [Pseudomonadota bacterium]